MQDPATTEQLSAYLDGELTDAEIAELENRLARDGELRAELDQLRAAVDLLRTHGPVQAPPQLYGDILRAVENEPAPGGFWAWLSRPFGLPLQAVAVAAVAVLVIGVSVAGALTFGGAAPREAARVADAKVDGPDAPLAKNDAPEEKSSSWGSRSGSSDEYETRKQVKKPAPSASTTDRKARAGDSEGEAPSKKDGLAGSVATDMAVGGKGNAQNAWEPTEGMDGSDAVADGSKAQASRGTADGGTSSGSSDGDFSMYSGSSAHTLAVRPADLDLVARIFARHAGKGGGSTAKDLANLSAGTHARTLDLPDGAARNAFIQDLRRAFPGAFSSKITTDDTITLNKTQVELTLVVADIAPSGVRDTPPIQTYRSKAKEMDDLSEESAPASTGTEE